MPIPGILLIVTTNQNFYREAWVILMIISISFGIYIIFIVKNTSKIFFPKNKATGKTGLSR